MKKLHALFYGLIAITASSCMHHDHNIDITYSESNHEYSMKAYFGKSQTRKVENYMDKRLGRRSNLSFVNSRIDGTIALDDHTKFYIRKYPGTLEINLDKDENSMENYKQVKFMCQGIKKVLTK